MEENQRFGWNLDGVVFYRGGLWGEGGVMLKWMAGRGGAPFQQMHHCDNHSILPSFPSLFFLSCVVYFFFFTYISPPRPFLCLPVLSLYTLVMPLLMLFLHCYYLPKHPLCIPLLSKSVSIRFSHLYPRTPLYSLLHLAFAFSWVFFSIRA